MTRNYMTLLLALTVFTSAVVLAPSAACAAIQNLVVNGEFEIPSVPAGSWQAFPQASVPGWSSGETDIELWSQGFLGSPLLGSDGNPTGQTMEINWFVPNTVFQTVVPTSLASSTATLNFDAWVRGSASGTFQVFDVTANTSLTGIPQAIVATNLTEGNGGTWTLNSTVLTLVAGNTIEIRFTSTGDSSNSVHIDQVELLTDVVPEPAAFAIWSGLGMAVIGATCWRRRRRVNA